MRQTHRGKEKKAEWSKIVGPMRNKRKPATDYIARTRNKRAWTFMSGNKRKKKCGAIKKGCEVTTCHKKNENELRVGNSSNSYTSHKKNRGVARATTTTSPDRQARPVSERANMYSYNNKIVIFPRPKSTKYKNTRLVREKCWIREKRKKKEEKKSRASFVRSTTVTFWMAPFESCVTVETEAIDVDRPEGDYITYRKQRLFVLLARWNTWITNTQKRASRLAGLESWSQNVWSHLNEM